jgi:biotin carboxyl carrier protein
MQYFKVTVNGKAYEVSVEELSGGDVNFTAAQTGASVVHAAPPVSVSSAPVAQGISTGEEVVPAPLGGSIMEIKVKPGEQVKKGQVLLTLEALKMENEIVAPENGTVGQIFVQPKDSVNTGDALLTLRN